MSQRKEKIFRAGALLVAWMQRVFYGMLLVAVACAVGASYAPADWRATLIGLCWFLVGGAVVGLGLFVLANIVAERDIPDLASSTSTPGP